MLTHRRSPLLNAYARYQFGNSHIPRAQRTQSSPAASHDADNRRRRRRRAKSEARVLPAYQLLCWCVRVLDKRATLAHKHEHTLTLRRRRLGWRSLARTIEYANSVHGSSSCPNQIAHKLTRPAARSNPAQWLPRWSRRSRSRAHPPTPNRSSTAVASVKRAVTSSS